MSKPYVYFVDAPAVKLIKIGTSSDPRRRLRILEEASPVPLRLIGHVAGGYELERRLHEFLFDHHCRGEWFHYSEPVYECVSGILSGTFDHSTLPAKGVRAWALARRKTHDLAPDGRPYRRDAA